MQKLVIAIAALSLGATTAHSQCAGCDADFNKAERQKAQNEAAAEKERPAQRDKELREILPDKGGAADAADAKVKHREELEKQLNQPE